MAKYRMKEINLSDHVTHSYDFDHLIECLVMVSDWDWDLDEKLYQLLVDGFLKSEDNKRMVMVTQLTKDGSEIPLSNPMQTAQFFLPREVKSDGID